jgi:SRSO17 transposase
MDVSHVDRLGADLAGFITDVFGSLTRSGWQDRCGSYLHGLMLDGRRKSVQPMAARLPGVNDQALNHFVTNSPWPVEPVLGRLARRMDEALTPAAWALDDTGFCKDGDASVCVWPQYTGTAGKVTNCQVAVSVNMVTDTASCPVNWRLFLPEAWDPASRRAMADVAVKRARTSVPAGVRHREKWRLALDMLDQMAGWGLRPPLVVADAGYGDSGEFRLGLEERGLSYVVQTASTLSAHPGDATRATTPYEGSGRPPRLRYQDKPLSLKELVLATGPRQARVVTWRDGSRRRAGKPIRMRSRFVILHVRPAGKTLRTAHQGHDLPLAWLIAEWPPNSDEPVKYWLSNLPVGTPHRTLVRQAKLRWRIEHDYRELKTGLGLDHYEGRTWQGWHHHTTLVSAAHAFLTLQRLDPKAPAPA